MTTRCRIVCAAWPVLLGLMLASPAAPDDHRTLVLRGRVTDAHGAPIAGARVSIEGTRRAGASSDDAGQYELEMPVGSPADLARKPVAVRLRAARDGWRFELPGGAPELGLEMHIVEGDSGVAAAEARANQPRVTAAAVRALTEEVAGAAVAIVNFIGTRGQPHGAPRPFEMTAVAIASVGVPMASLPAPRRVELKDAVVEGTSADGGKHEEAADKEGKRKAPAEVKRGKEESLASTPSPAPATPTGPSPTPGAAPAPERSSSRDAARRSRDEAQERDRLRRRTADEERAHAAEEQHAIGAGDDDVPTRDDRGLRGATTRSEAPAIAAPETTSARGRTISRATVTAPRDTATAPTVPRPAPTPTRARGATTGSPSRTSTPRDTLAAPGPMAARDTAAARVRFKVAPGPAAPATAAKPATAAPARDTVASRPPGPASPPGPISYPSPESGPRARAAPLVIRAPGGRAPAPAAPAAAGDSCACRAEGTVEVDTDRRLPEHERVVVALAGNPAVADTVELFMGSPRSFKLTRVPCGAQRLRIVSLGSRRYQVVSPAAMGEFRCEHGGRVPFRVVLRPR